jgi:U3 small nucleolar RNA-associated protein 10
LENLTSNENYSQWVQQYVSPCIVNLTSATKEESLWRQIHYQILLKTRSDLGKVRLATLNVLQELSRKLGMNYQSLLPEAIPFMAELMEGIGDDVLFVLLRNKLFFSLDFKIQMMKLKKHVIV